MKEESDTFGIHLSKESFTCPISSQLFLDPVSAMPCGHTFESNVIAIWRNDNSTCPYCRQEIESIYPATPFFNELYNQFLEKNPSLRDEQYFDLDMFFAYLLGNKTNPSTLKKMISLLKVSEKHMNEISEQGISAAVCLLATQQGRELLKKESKLIEKIQPESINFINQIFPYRGMSGVYWTVNHTEGLELLSKDSEFRKKIKIDALNSISEEESYMGMSAVSWLAALPAGRALLAKDPELRAKIQAEGLNSICQNETCLGSSAVTWLTATEIGIDLFFEDEKLRDNTTPEGLNTIGKFDGWHGVSGVTWLASTLYGIGLLYLYPEFRKKIQAEGLNSIKQDGIFRGYSAVTFMTSFDKGVELLSIDPQLCEKITYEGFNAIGINEEQKGYSAVYYLIKHGCHLLLNSAHLRSLLSEEALNTVVEAEGEDKGKSAAYWLMHTKEGQALLELEPVLKTKIHLERPRRSVPTFFSNNENLILAEPRPSESINCSKSSEHFLQSRFV